MDPPGSADSWRDFQMVKDSRRSNRLDCKCNGSVGGGGVGRTDDERLEDAEPLPYSGLGLVLARPEPIGS